MRLCKRQFLFAAGFNKSSVIQLSFCHIFLLIISNVLVQYPFKLFGYYTTWGAFTYPILFILTDLTVRLTNAKRARKIIYFSMVPGLISSYFISCYIELVHTEGLHFFTTIHTVPLRIALASFTAYAAGQLLDIKVFQRYRRDATWWVAPSLSTTVGNLMDTALFFFIAFYQSSNVFLSQNWPEIALVDMFFKVAVSLLAFVPLYGLVLNWLTPNKNNNAE